MTTNTCSTREQAERLGKAEAEKMTRRGYPTTVVEVCQVRIDDALSLDGQGPSEMRYVRVPAVRWEAVLS